MLDKRATTTALTEPLLLPASSNEDDTANHHHHHDEEQADDEAATKSISIFQVRWFRWPCFIWDSIRRMEQDFAAESAMHQQRNDARLVRQQAAMASFEEAFQRRPPKLKLNPRRMCVFFLMGFGLTLLFLRVLWPMSQYYVHFVETTMAEYEQRQNYRGHNVN